ncbi:MAG TPA: hypothetical protein VFR33_05160 [Candidatus Dormibacteraeota bacterium]|nr:hypothetical protein [Candidatus Dormibacteraeota bacterium]
MSEVAEQGFIRAEAVRWSADEPLPGLVEIELTDADGHVWRFVDKAPVFDAENVLTPTTQYPVGISVACTIIERRDDRVVVDTAQPWGVESDGVARFIVHSDQVSIRG